MTDKHDSVEVRMKADNVTEEYFYEQFYKSNYEANGFCFKYGVDKGIKHIQSDVSSSPKNFYKLPDFIKYTPDFMVYDRYGKCYLVEVKGFKNDFCLKKKQYLAYKIWNDKHCKVNFFLKDWTIKKGIKEITVSLDNIRILLNKKRTNIMGNGQEDVYPIGYHLPYPDDPLCYKIPFRDLIKQFGGK